MKLLVSYGNLPLFQTSVINIGFGGVSLDSLNTFRYSTLAKPMYFMLLVQKNKSPLLGDLLNYPKRCVSCFLTLHLGLTLRSSSWEFSFLRYQLFRWLIKKFWDELGDVFLFHLWQMCTRQALWTNYMVSQEKTKSLVINLTPLEVSLKDTVESLREKNFVNFRDVVFTS